MQWGQELFHYSRFYRKKLSTDLIRNFRRYLHSENQQDSVDAHIKFLQIETELEERFANEPSSIRGSLGVENNVSVKL